MKTPIIIKSSSGNTIVSIESKLMTDERCIFISESITQEVAMEFMKQVRYLNGESDKPITVYINTPGGEVENGMMMYDVITGSKAPIRMLCTGTAYSMGAILFACAHERYMLPHSKIMLHEPLLGGKISGNASSIRSISESLLETKAMLNEILAKHTGKTIEEINEWTQYDHYFTAEEAVECGLCDGIKTFQEMM